MRAVTIITEGLITVVTKNPIPFWVALSFQKPVKIGI